MLDPITDPMQFAFMQRALIEIIIVGALCGLVGTFVVLRSLAFIGDALVHAVFPGVVLSSILGWNIMIGAFVFGGLTALSIGLLTRNRRVGHDTAIGVIFAAFFALGIVLISRQQGFRQDLNSLLFGNILGVSRSDIIISLAVALLVAAIVLALFKELLLVAFDSVMAASAGYPVFALDMLLLLLVTTTVVVSLQTVGNLLILALLVTPAAGARLLTDRLYRMLVLSVLIAIASGVIGLYISYHAGVSTSGAIALTATGVFLLAYIGAPRHGVLSQRLLHRRGLHHAHHYHPHDEELDVH